MLLSYWLQFRHAFERATSTVSQDEWKTAWRSQTDRTTLYTTRVLPQIAEVFGLACRNELFRVDMTLCAKSQSGHDVPLVFVESENIATSAHHEMWKLCSLAAPLKVLISCVEWCEDPGFWKSGGMRTHLTNKWSAIIKAHNEVWPQPSVYGFLIAEWQQTLRFYSLALGANGECIDPHRVLFEVMD